MSMNVNNWMMIGAAFIGIVSAAGIMIAEYHKQERRKHSMTTDLARLDKQVAMLKSQLEKLQKSQRPSAEAKSRTKRTPVKSNMSTVSDDYSSTREMDSSDMEFYDLSDEDTSKASTITPLDTVLKDIDERLDGGDLSQLTYVRETLENLCFEYPESSELLWRLGRTYYRLASDPEKTETKLENLNKGVEVCEQAINLKSDCCESHKWYVLILGVLMTMKPLRESMNMSVVFKAQLDKALQFKPEDSALLHGMGRFHYEIASLKWYEKKILNALVGKPPDCTYESAIKYLLQAEEKCPTAWKENKLALAKCYINMNNYTEAFKYLDGAKTMEPMNLANSMDAEIENLLTKHKRRREN